jgi:hypothetical protein
MKGKKYVTSIKVEKNTTAAKRWFGKTRREKGNRYNCCTI